MDTSSRLYSLDAFRGMTVAAMILVNNPGSWDSVYAPLLHAHWNGCTPTDLIFPFFLFIVGVSIQFAYQHKKVNGLTRDLFLKILRRTVIIFALGVFLSLVPKFNFAVVRIPGVLQRISLVFLVCSILYFKTTWLAQVRIAILLLVIYFLLLTLAPVPGIGAANLEPETNLGAWLDRQLLSGHLWAQSKTWDPEGLLSTIPAIATGILGLLTGHLFANVKEPAQKTTWIFFTGAMVTLLGLIWSLAFPINKSLWTSSFVLYTGGIAMQFFAACYWLIDVQGIRRWCVPFVYYGMNAIFVFVASGLLAKMLIRVKISADDGTEISLWSYIYQSVYASWLDPYLASLLFALTLVGLFLLVLWWMHGKKIFIKV